MCFQHFRDFFGLQKQPLKWIFLSLALLNSACSHKSAREPNYEKILTENNLLKKQQTYQSSRLKADDDEIERLRQTLSEFRRNLEQIKKAPDERVVPVADKPVTPQIIEDGDLSSEHLIYAQILGAFDKKDLGSLIRARSILNKNFPDGIFADKAAFLHAKLLSDMGSRKEALSALAELLAKNPTGDKAAAALLELAHLRKAVGNSGSAIDPLRTLIKKFPGSPEARQAALELNIKRGG